MKDDRTSNATRNVAFGIILKVVAIIFPFIIRTVMLYVMGSEYVGLNSLFTSILSFLSLAELGVGQALVYSMYKPIAENDIRSISALLNLYKKLYRLIGTIILIVGVAIVPFLSSLVKGSCPNEINLYILYGIYLFNTIASYWLFGYKQSLLIAHQRSDIVSKRSLIIQTSMYVAQIIVLFATKNYYIYIVLLPIFTVITNIANSIIVDKMYPEIKCIGRVEKAVEDSIKKKVIALFGTKANSVVMHALDNIIISAFLGLTIVAKYGNYYYIMNSIIGIMTILYSSITAGLGNTLIVDSKEKVYKDFKALTFMNAWMVAFCTTSLLCLYQSFMKLWVGTELLLDMKVVLLLVIYFYVYQIRRMVLTYKDAGGIWWEDRFRPYVMMITNLVGNVILVQVIGLYGVILSTIIAMCVSWPWENYTLFKHIFKMPLIEYYFTLLKHIAMTAICCGITWLLCSTFVDGVLGLCLRALVCVLVPNILYMVIFHKTEEFSYVRIKVESLFRKCIK